MSKYWLLKVDAPHVSTFSVWESEKTPEGPKWTCIEADPFSNWMKNRHVASVGDYLKSRKFKYEWIKEDTIEPEENIDDAERLWRKKIYKCCLGA
jgi:hypothetical protein